MDYDPNQSEGKRYTFTRYKISNIPVQKWNCLTLCIDTRTMDVYLDGKLVKTCVLPGLPDLTDNDQAAIHINPLNPENNEMGVDGEKGFAGHLSKMEYYGRGLNPRDVSKSKIDGAIGGFINVLFQTLAIFAGGSLLGAGVSRLARGRVKTERQYLMELEIF